MRGYEGIRVSPGKKAGEAKIRTVLGKGGSRELSYFMRENARDVNLVDLRKSLAKIKNSLSSEVIASRRERL